MTTDPHNQQRESVEIRSFVYESFDERHVDLFRRAWSAYVERGEIKPLAPGHLRALYAANPSGASVVTVASQGERWLGLVAGLATDVVLPDGRTERAFQIGDFMVDQAVQRQGIGGRLLEGLLAFLRTQGYAVYTFPNRRSVEVFLRQGFEEIRSLQPLLFAPLPGRWARRRLAARGLRARGLTLEQASRLADELANQPRATPEIRKNSRYLRWRYAEMRDSAEFHFLGIETDDGTAAGLVVSTSYRFRGIPFGVVVDVLGGDGFREPLHCGVGLGAGGWVGFSTVERDSDWPAPPLAIELPARFQPRPVRLLVPPGDERS